MSQDNDDFNFQADPIQNDFNSYRDGEPAMQ